VLGLVDGFSEMEGCNDGGVVSIAFFTRWPLFMPCLIVVGCIEGANEGTCDGRCDGITEGFCDGA
jgi:hypothetical protein